MNKLKFLKFFFFFIIGIFIFKWVYDFFGGSEAINLINENKTKLYLLIFAHVPTLYFDSLSWYILLKNKSFTLYWSILITWISQASGKFFPTGNVTGEFVRVYLGITKGLSTHEASSTVFADLILATFSLFLMAFFSFIFIFINDASLINSENSFYFYFSLCIIFLGCLFFFILIKNRLLVFFLRKINKFFKISISKRTILFLLKWKK